MQTLKLRQNLEVNSVTAGQSGGNDGSAIS